MSEIDLTINNNMNKKDIQGLVSSNSDRIVLKINSAAKSIVWEKFFIVLLDDKKTEYSCCKKCKLLYNLYNNGKLVGTNGMKGHQCKIIDHNQTIDKSFFRIPPKSVIDKLNESIVVGLCQDLNPMKSVSNSGFLKIASQFVKIGAKYGDIRPEDLIKNRTTLKRKYLPECYNEKVKLVKDLLSKSNNYAFTTDIWSDKYMQNNYITITTQFLDTNYNYVNIALATFQISVKTKKSIQNYIRNAIKDFFVDIDSILDYSYFVTDNASNMKNITTNWIGCCSHNINLCLSHGFDPDFISNLSSIENTIAGCKKIVKYFKKSNNSSCLKTSLKQCVITRWNSTLIMLESIQNNWEELTTFLKNNNRAHKLINVKKYIIDWLVVILIPFKKCTDEIGSNTYSTIDKVAKNKFELLLHLNNQLNENDEMKELVQNLIKYVNEKYHLYDIHYTAAFLNPRFPI